MLGAKNLVRTGLRAANADRSDKKYGRVKMVSDLLLSEFDEEAKKTRAMLERVPPCS